MFDRLMPHRSAQISAASINMAQYPRDDGLIVKRIAINPVDRRFSVCSDNAAYPDWADVDPAAIAIVGRVIWTGRRIK